MKTFEEAYEIANKWEGEKLAGHGALVARALLARIHAIQHGCVMARVHRSADGTCHAIYTQEGFKLPDGSPLFAAGSLASPQVTDEQIRELWMNLTDGAENYRQILKFARALLSAPPAAEASDAEKRFDALSGAVKQLEQVQAARLIREAAAPQEAKPVAVDRAIRQEERACRAEDALIDLVNQISKTNPVDDHGHNLKMNMAYIKAVELLDASAASEAICDAAPQEQAPVVDRDAVIEEVAKHVWQYKAAGVIPSWLMLEISGICKYIRDMQSQPQQVTG